MGFNRASTFTKGKVQKAEKSWANHRKEDQPLPEATADEGTPERAYTSEASSC